jgi:hypothetical protein
MARSVHLGCIQLALCDKGLLDLSSIPHELIAGEDFRCCRTQSIIIHTGGQDERIFIMESRSISSTDALTSLIILQVESQGWLLEWLLFLSRS